MDRLCSLCGKKVQNEARTNCNHSYCYNCIDKWMNEETSCAKCLGKITLVRILSEPPATSSVDDTYTENDEPVPGPSCINSPSSSRNLAGTSFEKPFQIVDAFIDDEDRSGDKDSSDSSGENTTELTLLTISPNSLDSRNENLSEQTISVSPYPDFDSLEEDHAQEIGQPDPTSSAQDSTDLKSDDILQPREPEPKPEPIPSTSSGIEEDYVQERLHHSQVAADFVPNEADHAQEIGQPDPTSSAQDSTDLKSDDILQPQEPEPIPYSSNTSYSDSSLDDLSPSTSDSDEQNPTDPTSSGNLHPSEPVASTSREGVSTEGKLNPRLSPSFSESGDGNMTDPFLGFSSSPLISESSDGNITSRSSTHDSSKPEYSESSDEKLKEQLKEKNLKLCTTSSSKLHPPEPVASTSPKRSPTKHRSTTRPVLSHSESSEEDLKKTRVKPRTTSSSKLHPPEPVASTSPKRSPTKHRSTTRPVLSHSESSEEDLKKTRVKPRTTSSGKLHPSESVASTSPKRSPTKHRSTTRPVLSHSESSVEDLKKTRVKPRTTSSGNLDPSESVASTSREQDPRELNLNIGSSPPQSDFNDEDRRGKMTKFTSSSSNSPTGEEDSSKAKLKVGTSSTGSDSDERNLVGLTSNDSLQSSEPVASTSSEQDPRELNLNSGSSPTFSDSSVEDRGGKIAKFTLSSSNSPAGEEDSSEAKLNVGTSPTGSDSEQRNLASLTSNGFLVPSDQLIASTSRQRNTTEEKFFPRPTPVHTDSSDDDPVINILHFSPPSISPISSEEYPVERLSVGSSPSGSVSGEQIPNDVPSNNLRDPSDPVASTSGEQHPPEQVESCSSESSSSDSDENPADSTSSGNHPSGTNTTTSGEQYPTDFVLNSNPHSRVYDYRSEQHSSEETLNKGSNASGSNSTEQDFSEKTRQHYTTAHYQCSNSSSSSGSCTDNLSLVDEMLRLLMYPLRVRNAATEVLKRTELHTNCRQVNQEGEGDKTEEENNEVGEDKDEEKEKDDMKEEKEKDDTKEEK